MAKPRAECKVLSEYSKDYTKFNASGLILVKICYLAFWKVAKVFPVITPVAKYWADLVKIFSIPYSNKSFVKIYLSLSFLVSKNILVWNV